MGRENTSKGKSVRAGKVGILGTLGNMGIVGRENTTREQRWEWKGVAADTCWIIGSCFSARDGWVLWVLPWWIQCSGYYHGPGIHSKSEDSGIYYPAKNLNFPQICPKMPQMAQKN